MGASKSVQDIMARVGDRKEKILDAKYERAFKKEVLSKIEVSSEIILSNREIKQIIKESKLERFYNEESNSFNIEYGQPVRIWYKRDRVNKNGVRPQDCVIGHLEFGSNRESFHIVVDEHISDEQFSEKLRNKYQ